MKDLDDFGQLMEKKFGLMSSFFLKTLHEISVLYGSKWDLKDPTTIDIVVNKENAQIIYEYTKAIRSGYNIGLPKKYMPKIKEARLKAHKYLWDEANDPLTTIERKIELVKLTSKTKQIHD